MQGPGEGANSLRAPDTAPPLDISITKLLPDGKAVVSIYNPDSEKTTTREYESTMVAQKMAVFIALTRGIGSQDPALLNIWLKTRGFPGLNAEQQAMHADPTGAAGAAVMADAATQAKGGGPEIVMEEDGVE